MTTINAPTRSGVRAHAPRLLAEFEVIYCNEVAGITAYFARRSTDLHQRG